MGAQNAAIQNVAREFEHISVFDRRERPSHGYRAVHVIARIQGKPIEVQIRTPVEHLWAELSEKLADVVSPDVKYGGGPKVVSDGLAQLSSWVLDLSKLDADLTEAKTQFVDLGPAAREIMPDKAREIEADIAKASALLSEMKTKYAATMERAIEGVRSIGNDFSDSV